jgi:hypothetical protein
LRKMRGVDLRVILPEDQIFNRDSVSTADTDYLFEK